MKTFKLNPANKLKSITVFGRLCKLDHEITMNDKDAKKYLAHELDGKQTFVECATTETTEATRTVKEGDPAVDATEGTTPADGAEGDNEGLTEV